MEQRVRRRDRLKRSRDGQRTIPELHGDIMAGSCGDEVEKSILPRIHSGKHTTNRDKNRSGN